MQRLITDMCHFLTMLWILNYIPLLRFSRATEHRTQWACACACVQIEIYYKDLAHTVMETESPEPGDKWCSSSVSLKACEQESRWFFSSSLSLKTGNQCPRRAERQREWRQARELDTKEQDSGEFLGFPFWLTYPKYWRIQQIRNTNGHRPKEK